MPISQSIKLHEIRNSKPIWVTFFKWEKAIADEYNNNKTLTFFLKKKLKQTSFFVT